MRAPLSKDGYEEVMGWEDRDGEEKTLDDAAAIKAGSGAGAMSAEACEIAATELGGFAGEARNQGGLALPVSLSMVCTRVMSLTSVAFVGRLGPVPLAAAALATTLGNVTGNSIMVGMASAVSTLGGQAYGAGSYHTLGYVLQRAVIILSIAALPISLAWWCSEGILVNLGQEPALAQASAAYIRALIPGLFFYAWNMCLTAYLQSQRVTKPAALAGVVAAVMHVPANVVFIHALKFGYVGAALATSWSNGVVLCLNVLYAVRFKVDEPGRETWPGFSARAATTEWKPFLALALPGILMMAEWWASEANILLAGLLPDPEYNVAAVSIFQVTNALAFMVPVGFSVAVSTRCANELGARRPAHAKFASRTAFCLILAVELIVSTLLLAVKRHWGRLYTDDERIVRLVSELLVPLAVYTFFDGMLCVATGVIKACGRQWVAGPVVFFSYYVVGIPLACWLSFGSPAIGAMGLVVGGTVGTIIHSVIILVLVQNTDWIGEVTRALERVEATGFCRKDAGGSDTDAEALLPDVCAEVELQDMKKKSGDN